MLSQTSQWSCFRTPAADARESRREASCKSEQDIYGHDSLTEPPQQLLLTLTASKLRAGCRHNACQDLQTLERQLSVSPGARLRWQSKRAALTDFTVIIASFTSESGDQYQAVCTWYGRSFLGFSHSSSESNQNLRSA